MTSDPGPERRAATRSTGLDQEHLVAMGEVAYWAARVERSLTFVVSALVSFDDGVGIQIGAAVTKGLAFQQLIQLGENVVEVPRFQGRIRDLFTALSPELRTAMSSRNYLLHGDWTIPTDGPALVTLMRKKGPSDRRFTVRQMQDVAYDLATLTTRLFGLFLIIQQDLDEEDFNLIS